MKIRLAAAAAFAALFVVGLVSPASAGKPETFHGREQEVDLDQIVCGLSNIDVTTDVRFFDQVFFDADGNFESFHGTSSGVVAFTNDAGVTVANHFANAVRETESIDETAGTITITTSVRGLPEMLKTPQGTVLIRDAGLINIVTVIDLATDEIISDEVVLQHGPHPEADSDFEAFCEVLTEHLS